MKHKKKILSTLIAILTNGSAYAADLTGVIISNKANSIGTYDNVTVQGNNVGDGDPAVVTYSGAGQNINITANQNMMIQGPASSSAVAGATRRDAITLFNPANTITLTANKNLEVGSTAGRLIGIHGENGQIKLQGEKVSFVNPVQLKPGEASIFVANNSNLQVAGAKGVSFESKTNNSNPSIWVTPGSTLSVISSDGNVEMTQAGTSSGNALIGALATGVLEYDKDSKATSTITIKGNNVNLDAKGAVLHTGTQGRVIGPAPSTGGPSRPAPPLQWFKSNIEIVAKDSNTFTSESRTFDTLAIGGNSSLKVTAETGNNNFTSTGSVNLASGNLAGGGNGATVVVEAPNGDNNFVSDGRNVGFVNSFASPNVVDVKITAKNNNFTAGSIAVSGETREGADLKPTNVLVEATEGANTMEGIRGNLAILNATDRAYVVASRGDKATVTLKAKTDNLINVNQAVSAGQHAYGVMADTKSAMNIEAERDNKVVSSDIGVTAKGKGIVTLNAANENSIVAKHVGIQATDVYTNKLNYNRAGTVTVNGATTNVIVEDGDALRAALGGHITVNNANVISGSDYAVRSGVTGTTGYADITEALADNNDTDVTVNYLAGAQITGKILADRGTVTVKPTDGVTGNLVNSTGNRVLAINNGVVNLDLGTGSQWNGTTYTFDDLGTVTSDATEVARAATLPHVVADAGSNAITKPSEYLSSTYDLAPYTKGEVHINVGNNSIWNPEKQSFVTTTNGVGAIDLSHSYTTDSTGALVPQRTQAGSIHIGEMKGTNNFIVHLDTVDNAADSDVIYAKKGKSGQTLTIANKDELFPRINVGEYVRVATITDSTQDEFGANHTVLDSTYGNLYDSHVTLEYSKNSLIYDSSNNYNSAYNGSAFTNYKPGNDYIEKQYGDHTKVTNVYITKRSQISDTAKVIPNIERAAYGWISELDNLHKRLGEAQYMQDNHNIWTRLRYTRVGKADSFNLRSKTIEIGKDWKRDYEDSRVRHYGLSFKYSWDSVTIPKVATNNAKLRTWSIGGYDTLHKPNGYYHDLIARIGKVKFNYNVVSGGTHGAYSQTFYQLGAEFGKKYKRPNRTFIEPQAQLQWTHLNGSSYTTNNLTKVELDSTNSLIGRLGVRVGREYGEEKLRSFYGYANVLREFLGGQNVYAFDRTGTLSADISNKGTWFTLGLGSSTQLGKRTTAHIDFEKSFGNDFKNTYRINLGVRHKF